MTPIELNGRLKRSEKMVLVMIASALACVLLSLISGALGALYYIPGVSARMVQHGVSLVQLRPLHTSFASAWLFLGAAACVYRFLFQAYGEPTRGDWLRFRFHMVVWGLAGLGILFTLPFGITSGREYLGFHPAFSLLIWIGWIAFAWTFFSKVWRGFFSQPVYVYMWAVGIVFFLWTFAEGHAYLLPFVRDYPIADLQIQWKSCGTLVASFNQMIYGALIYLGVQKSGDDRPAQSGTAFALLGIGLLNSFTNYAHHTYHLPQAHLIKWIAFVVSMLEILILVKMFQELLATIHRRTPPYREVRTVSDRFLSFAKAWNFYLLLPLAILISIPPANTLIHGTHVVMGHAMGSMLAIDSYILFAAFSYILAEVFPKREVSAKWIEGPRAWTIAGQMNVLLMALVALLLATGLTVGVQRYLDRPMPTWLDHFPYALVLLGCALALAMVRLIAQWLPLLLDPARHRAFAEQPAEVAARTGARDA